MKFGLDQKSFEFINSNIVAPLLERGCKVYVFGSRARADHRKFSDLDLLIESDSNIQILLGQLEELLIESDLPIKVDLVLEQNLASSYRPSVDEDKMPWC